MSKALQDLNYQKNVNNLLHVGFSDVVKSQ